MRKILAKAVCMVAGNRSAKGLKLSRQLKIYKELDNMQWGSIEENRKRQRRDLYRCIIHAIKTVPYYRTLGFSEQDFSEDTIYVDIRKLPILTKDILRREGDCMMSDDIKDWTYVSTSGGTTGEPISFLHSGKFFDYDQAGKILFDSWIGRGIGDKQMRLWGSERDIISGKKDWMNKLYRWCRNEIFVNTFSMTDYDMKLCVETIKKKKPKMILAYVQSAREIAAYAEKCGITLTPIKGG